MGRAAGMNLSPLREAVLREAQRDVEAIAADADRRAADEIERARREAGATLDRARVEGDTAGAIETARGRAAARAAARRVVLGARREAYDELRQRCRKAALDLRNQDGYTRLLEGLVAAARAQLGPDTELELDPPAVGGARGRADRRRVDYTLPALADRCLEALGPDLQALW